MSTVSGLWTEFLNWRVQLDLVGDYCSGVWGAVTIIINISVKSSNWLIKLEV